MFRVLLFLVVTFTYLSVVEGAFRSRGTYRGYTRYTRYTRYTYVGGGYIAGYAFAGIIGLLILLLLIYFCVKHVNTKKQRVRQQPVIVYNGTSSVHRPYQGTVAQPPPYMGPPPVYSAGPLSPNQKPGGAPPPPPYHQLRHRGPDPFYTPGSAFPPPLQQYPPQPQPQLPPPQNRLSPLPGINQGQAGGRDTVGPIPSSSQANTQTNGQEATSSPLQPLQPPASAPPADV